MSNYPSPEGGVTVVKHKNLEFWVSQFMEYYEGKVGEATLSKYYKALGLFLMYNQDYGTTNVRQLSWTNIEEFISWWYLRKYIGGTSSEINTVFTVLSKFVTYLDRQNAIHSETKVWCKNLAVELKENAKRVLNWEFAHRKSRNNTVNDNYLWMRPFEPEATKRVEKVEGWFQIVKYLDGMAKVLELSSEAYYFVEIKDTLTKYIQVGDIFSGVLCQGRRKYFVDDESVWVLYPAVAKNYLR